MEELKVFKCPNCGANTTNQHNCEYCGSLLVRFAVQGLNVSDNYHNNTRLYPDLLDFLEINLLYQEEHPELPVATTIRTTEEYRNKSTVMRLNGVKDTGHVLTILRKSNCYWGDGEPIVFNYGEEEANGLCVVLKFENKKSGEGIFKNGIAFKSENKRNEEALQRFRNLDSSVLFIKKEYDYTQDYTGFDIHAVEYAIDFGCDAKGAALLISEILDKVYQYPLRDALIIDNTEGEEALMADSQTKETSLTKYLYWIGIIITILYVFGKIMAIASN